MSRKMLIDASHLQERRVAVLDNGKITDFEVETTHKVSAKGNIYLGKIVRVEPSLQAAFVDYGAERHGFLAFSDIHYNYYQIPVADREALEKEKQKIFESADADEDHVVDDLDGTYESLSEDDTHLVEETDAISSEDVEIEVVGDELGEVEKSGPAALDKKKFRRLLQHYKIQEVIKRGQIVLIQVVKDERGNKGAALTTYISLPGRYCVLMPNALHVGGVSRKISDPKDRKRLRKILEDLDLPQNMSLIVRTAGKDRNKTELKKDSEYLLRLWQDICDKTIHSLAPSVVYEEANLVRQAMRDLYRKEIEEIIVDGKEAYQDAKAYIKQLMPSHSKRVKLHKGEASLFYVEGVEEQLEELYKSQVTLPSGGYLVINQTEALVSIDINSGRATRERNISETALKTNLEASIEIARQLRLRNLAGLIVVDFIDMDLSKHVANVERKFREAMREDRARVQIGQISQFGLLELSRQRLGVSYHETITQPCPQCRGHGMIPATKAIALKALRQIQQLGVKLNNPKLVVRVHPQVVISLLNEYRSEVSQIETHLKKSVQIEMDERLLLDEVILGNQKIAALDMDSGNKKSVKSQNTKKKTPPPQNIPEGVDVAVEPVQEDGGEQKQRRRRNRRRKWNQKPTEPGNILPNSEENQNSPGELHGSAVETEAAAHDKAETEKSTKKKRRWWKKTPEKASS